MGNTSPITRPIINLCHQLLDGVCVEISPNHRCVGSYARIELIPILQEEPSNSGHPHLTPQLYLVSIDSYSQPPTPLTDLPGFQLSYSFLSCPIWSHGAVCGATDRVFVDSRSRGKHPCDVILREFPTCGICGYYVALKTCGYLYQRFTGDVSPGGCEVIVTSFAH